MNPYYHVQIDGRHYRLYRRDIAMLDKRETAILLALLPLFRHLETGELILFFRRDTKKAISRIVGMGTSTVGRTVTTLSSLEIIPRIAYGKYLLAQNLLFPCRLPEDRH